MQVRTSSSVVQRSCSVGCAERQVRCCAQATAGRDTELRRWLTSHGGYVHEALQLTDNAPCGARGVVSGRRIAEAELMDKALVVVPKTLHLENKTACMMLKRYLDEGSSASSEHQSMMLDELEQVQQVAAALAVERRLGSRSTWAPYLDTLPEDPPCPWLLSNDQLTHTLHNMHALTASTNTTISSDASARQDNSSGQHPWHADVVSARARYQALAVELLEVLTPQLKLREEELMWALAQVVSRSLGSGSSSGLVPFLDMLNHSPDARPPMLQLDDDDRLVMTCTNVRQGELHPLEAGDELYLCYGELDCPKAAWLKFGFVPRESLKG